MSKYPPKSNYSVGIVTYNPTTGEGADHIARALEEYQGISFTQSKKSKNSAVAAYQEFKDIADNVSVRDGFNRSDYEYFRRSEAVPQDIHNIIASCMEAYRRVGIVRNIIDLMADFSVKGIRLLHPNPTIQKFYRGWFEKIGGPERSERFLNLLYRSGNAPVKRTLGKINTKYVEYLRSLAKDEGILEPEKVQMEKDPAHYVIPIRYDLLNPVNIHVAGGELAHFVGRTIYALKLPQRVINKILSPMNDEEKELIKSIPTEIYNRIRNGRTNIPLPPDNFHIYFWKKDDWQELGEPLIYCVFDSLLLLQKMQLADLAALDGAISQIRLWKLGDLERNIFPTDAAVSKLADILMSNPGGGAFDLIWGPDLQVEELKTSVHQFLGKEKYEPVLEAIYSGLGVPPTLTGTQNAAGTTNNFISLKTLTERLEYGRSILRTFWDEEIRLVQKAMGFRFPASIDFDRTILTDEAAEKALYIQLIDRNYISEETFLERFGECDELEVLRRRREEKERKKGTRAKRGGPWMVYEKEFEILKTFVQKGMITPKGADIEVEGKDFIDPRKMKTSPKTGVEENNKGTGGRPTNSPDSNKRTRNFKVRTSASEGDAADFMLTLTWAKEAYTEVTNIVQPAILQKYSKADTRSLTREQFDELENLKYNVLCILDPFTEVNEKVVADIIINGAMADDAFYELYDKLYIVSKNKKMAELTIDECRLLRLSVYATLKV